MQTSLKLLLLLDCILQKIIKDKNESLIIILGAIRWQKK